MPVLLVLLQGKTRGQFRQLQVLFPRSLMIRPACVLPLNQLSTFALEFLRVMRSEHQRSSVLTVLPSAGFMFV